MNRSKTRLLEASIALYTLDQSLSIILCFSINDIVLSVLESLSLDEYVKNQQIEIENEAQENQVNC